MGVSSGDTQSPPGVTAVGKCLGNTEVPPTPCSPVPTPPSLLVTPSHTAALPLLPAFALALSMVSAWLSCGNMAGNFVPLWAELCLPPITYSAAATEGKHSASITNHALRMSCPPPTSQPTPLQSISTLFHTNPRASHPAAGSRGSHCSPYPIACHSSCSMVLSAVAAGCRVRRGSSARQVSPSQPPCHAPAPQRGLPSPASVVGG